MPSPFPGMDPWLESPNIFPDVHDSLIFLLREAINFALPKPYFTRIANRVYFESNTDFCEPDINLFGRPRNGPPATVLEKPSGVRPVVVHAPAIEVTEQFLEIHSVPGDEHLVTTIEILSRENKRRAAKGRKLYRKKQRELVGRRINLVEIDLLRFGTHTTAVPLERAVRKTGPFDYHVCVHRPVRPEEYEVYPIRMADSLPKVAIPLLKDSPDVGIEMQPLLDRCYESGLYDRQTRYAQSCNPPLARDQQAWADAILREKGLIPPVPPVTSQP